MSLSIFGSLDTERRLLWALSPWASLMQDCYLEDSSSTKARQQSIGNKVSGTMSCSPSA